MRLDGVDVAHIAGSESASISGDMTYFVHLGTVHGEGEQVPSREDTYQYSQPTLTGAKIGARRMLVARFSPGRRPPRGRAPRARPAGRRSRPWPKLQKKENLRKTRGTLQPSQDRRRRAGPEIAERRIVKTREAREAAEVAPRLARPRGPPTTQHLKEIRLSTRHDQVRGPHWTGGPSSTTRSTLARVRRRPGAQRAASTTPAWSCRTSCASSTRRLCGVFRAFWLSLAVVADADAHRRAHTSMHDPSPSDSRKSLAWPGSSVTSARRRRGKRCDPLPPPGHAAGTHPEQG